MDNSILSKFAEAIFQSFIPGHKIIKDNEEIDISDDEFVDKVIKLADVFDVDDYKVKRIHTTDLKWKEVGKTLVIKMEFELEKIKEKT